MNTSQLKIQIRNIVGIDVTDKASATVASLALKQVADIMKDMNDHSGYEAMYRMSIYAIELRNAMAR